MRKSAPLAPIASWARNGLGPSKVRTRLSIFQNGMLVARCTRSPASVTPQNSTSRTNDQWSETGTGINPSAQSSCVTAEGEGSTTSQTLLISCGNAGWAMPTPSADDGNPEVTERISMPGKAARNKA